MSLRDNTKVLFADTLREMIKEMPFDKVRVGELCKRCGANRRTFYYHFIDKYDLVAWIWMNDYMKALDAEQGRYTLQHVINTLELMYKDRSFYKAVFSDNSQNSIRKGMVSYYYELGTNLMKQLLGLEVLPIEMDYAVKSHAYASIGMCFDWLLGKVNYTPEEFARLQFHFMPAELKDAYGIEGDC